MKHSRSIWSVVVGVTLMSRFNELDGAVRTENALQDFLITTPHPCWRLGTRLIKTLIILLLISSPLSFVSSCHMATFHGQINSVELIKLIILIIQSLIGWNYDPIPPSPHPRFKLPSYSISVYQNRWRLVEFIFGKSKKISTCSFSPKVLLTGSWRRDVTGSVLLGREDFESYCRTLIGYIVHHLFISLISDWLNCFLAPPLLGQTNRAQRRHADCRKTRYYAQISHFTNMSGYI